MWEDYEALEAEVGDSYNKGYAEGHKVGVEAGLELAISRMMRTLSSPTDTRRAEIEQSLRDAVLHD